MSYIRPLSHNGAGLYIYPDTAGYINFLGFPDCTEGQITDEMLDILLLKMSDEEIASRRKHGSILLKALEKQDKDAWDKNKDYWKEDKEW